MTEEEAKTRWCPYARSRAFASEATVNRPFPGDGSGDLPHAECRCIGSACMAWRWDVPDPSTYAEGVAPGHCGLAGKP